MKFVKISNNLAEVLPKHLVYPFSSFANLRYINESDIKWKTLESLGHLGITESMWYAVEPHTLTKLHNLFYV